MILWGCVIRIIGFILLAVSTNFTTIVLGAFFTGFAGALFTPSSQAYLASEYPDNQERNRVFVLQRLASEAGMLIGPLIGLSLFTMDFLWVGISSAAIFSILLVLQWHYLPTNTKVQHSDPKQLFLLDWWVMLQNKPFIYFALATSAYPILFHQLYLSIPHQIRTQTGDPSIITVVFMVSSLMGVLLQLPTATWD